eukprot:Hpha_TRINITY_DN2090_c0_g1::TRINITY_DN2090_c0_g1_i1::g.83048::m.83048
MGLLSRLSRHSLGRCGKCLKLDILLCCAARNCSSGNEPRNSKLLSLLLDTVSVSRCGSPLNPSKLVRAFPVRKRCRSIGKRSSRSGRDQLLHRKSTDLMELRHRSRSLTRARGNCGSYRSRHPSCRYRYSQHSAPRSRDGEARALAAVGLAERLPLTRPLPVLRGARGGSGVGEAIRTLDPPGEGERNRGGATPLGVAPELDWRRRGRGLGETARPGGAKKVVGGGGRRRWGFGAEWDTARDLDGTDRAELWPLAGALNNTRRRAVIAGIGGGRAAPPLCGGDVIIGPPPPPPIPPQAPQ